MKFFGLMLFTLLGGCWFLDMAAPITGGTSDWYYTGPVRKSRQEIYKTVVTTVRRQGFQISSRDPDLSRLETDWDVHMSIHWRNGFRTMLEVELIPEAGGMVNVRMRAIRDINDNSSNPIIESRARWIPAGMSEKQNSRIPVPAMRLHQSLKLTFFGYQNG